MGDHKPDDLLHLTERMEDTALRHVDEAPLKGMLTRLINVLEGGETTENRVALSKDGYVIILEILRDVRCVLQEITEGLWCGENTSIALLRSAINLRKGVVASAAMTIWMIGSLVEEMHRDDVLGRKEAVDAIKFFEKFGARICELRGLRGSDTVETEDIISSMMARVQLHPPEDDEIYRMLNEVGGHRVGDLC